MDERIISMLIQSLTRFTPKVVIMKTTEYPADGGETLSLALRGFLHFRIRLQVDFYPDYFIMFLYYT